MGSGSSRFLRYKAAALFEVQKLASEDRQSLQEILTVLRMCAEKSPRDPLSGPREEEKGREQEAEKPRGSLLQEGSAVTDE